MNKKLGKMVITALIALIPLLVVSGVLLAYSDVGMAKDIGIQEPALYPVDYSVVPQAVIDKAAVIAANYADNGEEKVQSFADELIASYIEAQNNDVIIIFNSGGLGWNLTEKTPGWASILKGIQSELQEMGYKSQVLNYRRTGSGVKAVVGEIIEAARLYPKKLDDLVWRIEFLTETLPDLKIIVTGESTGTVITDKVMERLKENPQVYSIQTGMPFWHKSSTLERTLLINNNGICVDTFSYGDIPTMLWITVKGWFGFDIPDENPGNILSWLRAPGHHYTWEYPNVYNSVIEFLKNNF